MTNLFGLDVAGLDVDAFLAAARALFVLGALLWLALLARVRRPEWLLAGVLAANAWAWGVTNYPLGRLYAMGPSHDRVGNVALCQVVAAGHSPLRTAQVGQLHFEPFWSLLVALVSGFDPERVLRLYPFLSLATLVAFVLALYRGLEPWPAWERVAVAGFATLLSSAPLDHTATYDLPWAKTFLLKPNHAMGLVLFPLVLRAFLRMRTWWQRIGVGLLLHLLAWAFVLHMVYVAAGLVVFAALSWLARREERRRDALDVAAVIGVNLAIVSPYLVMLLVGYPFLQPSPGMVIAPTSPHLLELTTRFGPLFFVALWGLRAAWRHDRLGRLWASQVIAALALWAGYYVLHALQLARERDEVFYWSRFLLAGSAGLGAWDLAGRALAAARQETGPVARAAVVALAALPFALPAWWNPLRMDDYFPGSLAPLPAHVAAPTDYLRRETPVKAVVAGDREYAVWVSALGARRVLLSDSLHRPKDFPRRRQLEEDLVRGASAKTIDEARAYGVEYLVVTPGLLALYPDVPAERLDRDPHLERVHYSDAPDGGFVAVYRIRTEARSS